MLRRLIFLSVAGLALPADPVRAEATIAFGSSVGAVNLTSTGAVMDGRFSFELGCFSAGFVPTRANTAAWLAHWKAFPEGTAAYRTDYLGAPFPAEHRLNSFAGTTMVLDNTLPFATGVPVYLWGFDRRAAEGAGEWILVTAPSWICPDGSSVNPAVSYAIANASTAIVGTINQNGIEMRTAAVALSTAPESFADWRGRHFGEGQGDSGIELTVWGALADPDQDGRANLMEYFLGTDPKYLDEAELSGPFADAGAVVMRYRRSALTTEVFGSMEWSADLSQWSQSGLTESVLMQDGASVLMEVRLASPPVGAAFFRLKVEQ